MSAPVVQLFYFVSPILFKSSGYIHKHFFKQESCYLYNAEDEIEKPFEGNIFPFVFY